MRKNGSICIICGSSERSPLYASGQWQVYKCPGCELGVLNPRPAKEELEKLYAENYFQSHYNSPLAISSMAMQKRLKQEDHRLRFFRRLKPAGKILDIGCGRGYFLLACRKAGYKVEGVDISTVAATYVEGELKIPVRIGEFDKINFGTDSYDVITMWHSLEHTNDPNNYLIKARRLLKDDGILIVDVPNYEGHDAKMNWQGWPHWDLPYHFYHFTKRSLIALLKKHRFIVVWEKNYLSEYEKEKWKKRGLPNFLARYVAHFYSGGSIAVIAKKSGI
jgi:2-polyprenyl-3-methyl-5-hydroxy-6-metoxy-1,4-benzoquinol methylase